jgi:hypothetical protein
MSSNTSETAFYVYLMLIQPALVTLLSYPGVLWPLKEVEDTTKGLFIRVARSLIVVCACTWPIALFYEATKVAQR